MVSVLRKLNRSTQMKILAYIDDRIAPAPRASAPRARLRTVPAAPQAAHWNRAAPPGSGIHISNGSPQRGQFTCAGLGGP
jgi:hypothetical protein